MNILIREASVEDAEAISSIGVASWSVAYHGIIPDEYLNSLSIEKKEKFIARSLTVPNNHFIIADIDGQPAGMACFYPLCSEITVKDAWELEALYILPQYWRKGIGHALIQHIFEYMRVRKALICNLWVLADNYRARSFYEHVGLSSTGIERNIEIGGKDLTEVRYSICL